MNRQKLYDTYFAEPTRGYGFIRNFHAKYRAHFTGTDLADADAFVNQIFLNLSSLASENIKGIEEHYVVKAIYYQCWNLLHRSKPSVVVPDRSAGGSLPDHAASKTESPSERIEGAELFEHINLFKTTLTEEEIRILNALLDERSPAEIAQQERMNYNTVNTKILRLRKRLSVFLIKRGFESQYFKKQK